MKNFINIGDINKQDLRKIIEHAKSQKKKRFNINKSAIDPEKPLIDKEIISQVKIQIATYNKDDLPKHLKDSKAIKPGSRNL